MKKNLASTRLWGMVFPSIGFLGGTGTLVVMWLGGYYLMYGKITLGDFIALNAYYTMLMWPVVALAWIMNLYQRGVASLKRLEEIYTSPAEEDFGASPERLQGSVEFKHVSLAKGGRHILRDVSFTVNPGEKLLLIGPTGSGKSTIMSLLLGLDGGYEGTIAIDGRDADWLSPSARRARMAIVPQEPFLYSMSIKDNLFSNDNLETLLHAVRLEDEVDRFEKKLETIVGERGVMLSGGQKQRLTMARALARRPDILLLDDPFTNVDGYTEHMIWENIRPLIKDMTVIITSTRPVPVAFVDKVLVLSDGGVVEEGKPDELLEKSP
jgi:ATP-binding cassette subfamily B protein